MRTQLLADGKKYGQQGLDCLPKFNKPDGTSDADFQKTKDQMTGIFDAAIGIACLTAKDNACAVTHLKPAVDASPDNQKDFSLVYPLALAYLGQTPAGLSERDLVCGAGGGGCSAGSSGTD